MDENEFAALFRLRRKWESDTVAKLYVLMSHSESHIYYLAGK